jgi:hypothetical protein
MNDTLVFSGLVVALLAVGFGAIWIVIGQNPLIIFRPKGALLLPTSSTSTRSCAGLSEFGARLTVLKKD